MGTSNLVVAQSAWGVDPWRECLTCRTLPMRPLWSLCIMFAWRGSAGSGLAMGWQAEQYVFWNPSWASREAALGLLRWDCGRSGSAGGRTTISFPSQKWVDELLFWFRNLRCQLKKGEVRSSVWTYQRRVPYVSPVKSERKSLLQLFQKYSPFFWIGAWGNWSPKGTLLWTLKMRICLWSPSVSQIW